MGISTKNFSLLHDIIQVLRERNISFVVISSLEKIPSNVGVILTSSAEMKNIEKNARMVAADAYSSINTAVDKALHTLSGKTQYTKIIVGVDPGEYPGVAIFGDEILLHKWHTGSPDDAAKIVKQVVAGYRGIEDKIIRIGHGSLITRNRIINELININIPIEIVDERNTTPSDGTPRYDRDVEAAAKIALIPGKRVVKRFMLKPTRGDVRDLQKKSRLLTNGKYSISEEDALRVLKGEITLEKTLKNR